jgi:hypothetical protein
MRLFPAKPVKRHEAAWKGLDNTDIEGAQEASFLCKLKRFETGVVVELE